MRFFSFTQVKAVLVAAVVVAVLGTGRAMHSIPDENDSNQGATWPVHEWPDADTMLEMAFGEECPELKWTLKMKMASRGIVVAADSLPTVANGGQKGQYELRPFSMAFFTKKGPDAYPEITNVQCDIARVTFDGPINKMEDLSSRRVIALEFMKGVGPQPRIKGGILLTNNCQTARLDDDLSLVTPGPLSYDVRTQCCSTKEVVRWIWKGENEQDPFSATATGMEIQLALHEEGIVPGPWIGPSLRSVKHVKLQSEVDMRIFLEPHALSPLGCELVKIEASGARIIERDRQLGRRLPEKWADEFIPKRENRPLARKERTLAVIKTQGPFTYEPSSGRAQFDISQNPGPHPNQVTLFVRSEADGNLEQLVCDRLQLQVGSQQKDKNAAGLATCPFRVTTIRATGKNLVLTSDRNVYTFFGTELTWDRARGQAILRAIPEAIGLTGGSEIYAERMKLIFSEWPLR